MTLRQRELPIRDEAHLKFVRQQPCCHFKGCSRPSEAAHIRMGCPARGKFPTGMGIKPSDCWTVPLCGYHHREGPDAQHRMSEEEYWKFRGIDQFALALSLWEKSGGAARAAEREANPKPKREKLTAPRKPQEQRAKIQARSTFPPGRKLQSRPFSRPNC